MLSVLIPARNEVYLQKTIENLLENAEGEIEIIAVLDGYWPNPPIKDDPRVKLIHHTNPIGQRQSINEAAKIAQGEFIMKLDGHSAVGKGFDVILAKDCKPDWTVIPRMYNLNIENWQPKLHKRTDYMYIGCEEGRLLRAEYYTHRQPDNDLLIDDVMCCMGCGWFMRKDRFWELGGCDENHGSWGQQGVEVSLKAWLSGGRMVVNKKTWFAHWFRGGGGGGFPYPMKGKDQERARKYSKDLWLNDKWEKQTRPFQWLIDRFSPPGWDRTPTINDYKDKFKDQTCYIVGSGTSILNTTADTFAGEGVIIALNGAINHIESLNLINPTFSMQKDQAVIRPQRSILLVHEHESLDAFKDYSPRFKFDAKKLFPNSPFGHKEFSANCALKIAQLLGCNKIVMVGFDSCTTGSVERVEHEYSKHEKGAVLRQCQRMKDTINNDKLNVTWL